MQEKIQGIKIQAQAHITLIVMVDTLCQFGKFRNLTKWLKSPTSKDVEDMP